MPGAGVLVYRFTEDWNGEVVAEECGTGEQLYFGLRFPASDIPSQARALYTACRLRTVLTSSYTPARIVGYEDSRPIDLTHAVLRSISPVHLEYMRNMGVTASLGISLMHGDRLWGLITCNHESGPMFTPHDTRTACAAIGEAVSSFIEQKQAVARAQDQAGYLVTQGELLKQVVQDGDVVRGLTQHATSISAVTQSAGAVLRYDDALHCVGITPDREAVGALLAWLEQEGHEHLRCESLSARYPAALAWKDVGAGIIATRIARFDGGTVRHENWIVWFRPEVLQSVSWGGDPRKPTSTNPNERLHPRKSFDQWKEEVHLRCVPFTPADVAASKSLATALTDVILEIEAARQIRRTAALLETLTGKLRERERSLQLVLDSTGDGLVLVALDGTVLAERSRAIDRWFPSLSPQARIWDVLFSDDPHQAEGFAQMWWQLASDQLPFVVASDQMTRELVRDGRTFELGYKEVRENDDALRSILMTVVDVTERRAALDAALTATETQTLLGWVLRDARGLGRTLGELGALVAAARAPTPVERLRSLHTLKGNAAVLGLVRLPEMCHALESLLQDDPSAAIDLGPVDDEIARLRARAHELAGDDVFDRADVSREELTKFIADLDASGAVPQLVPRLRRWALEPVARPLGKLANHARTLAGKLGKEVEVVVVHNDARADADTFEALWGVLGHVVSNAVDHGIESPFAREAHGKPPHGRVVLSAHEQQEGWLTIEVQDDGAGIDVDAVRKAAAHTAAASGDALEAVFLDGLSTRSEVTSTSGRGVGLAAVRAVCTELGGGVQVSTTPGRGTTVMARIPMSSPRA